MPREQSRVERHYPIDERVGWADKPAWWQHEWPWDPMLYPGVQEYDASRWGQPIPSETRWPDSPNRLYRQRMLGTTEALMSCAPGAEPELTAIDMLSMREALIDAVDALPEREREVVDALFIRRESLRECGRSMGWSRTHVARIRDNAVTSLRARLSAVPAIIECLEAA